MELKTIEKALMVLKCFAGEETFLGTTELANRLDTNKATMSRVLSTLKKHGFLEKDTASRRYRLGPAMVGMAKAVYRLLDGRVTSVAAPYADALRDSVGERVHVEVLTGNHIYLAYVADTPNPVSVKLEPGDQVTPNAHAGSKAIVAFSQPSAIESWLARAFIRYTKNTCMDRDELRSTYEKIRENGVAYDFGEHLDEVNAVGAPIFNHENEPIASIILVVPSYRMEATWKQGDICLLKQAANAISSQLHSTRQI